jgi:glucose/arabinose dehydrogenase
MHQSGRASGEYEDFVTGFAVDNGHVWGRPVGVTVAPDGSLLVTDDGSNTIWRVSYAGKAGGQKSASGQEHVIHATKTASN